MFEKNDKSLLSVRTVVNVVTVVLLIFMIAAGVVLIIVGADSEESLIFVGIAMILFGALLSWLFCVFMRLFLSFICDVKLIRNKLYDAPNSNLDVFIESAQPPALKEHQSAEVSVDNMKLLRDLKTLYDSGAIDEREYNNEKAKLLK